MTEVLVTGGLGFIGKRVVGVLRERGFRVVILDNLERQVHGPRRASVVGKGTKLLIADIRSSRAWQSALKSAEYVIHLAAMTGSAQSFWKSKKYFDVNSSGSANLAQLLVTSTLKRTVRKVVYASTSYVYGEGSYRCQFDGLVFPPSRSLDQLRRGDWEVKCPSCGRPVAPVATAESKPPQTPNPYSISKLAGERLILSTCEVVDIPSVALRYFNVYGPGQSMINPYTGVLTVFLNRLIQQRPAQIFEDGCMRRDFVYVSDVAKLTVDAIEKGDGVVNIGTGRPTSILEIYRLLSREVPPKSEYIVSQKSRPGDVRCIFADISRMRRLFGSRSLKSVNAGVKLFAEWGVNQTRTDRFDFAESERRTYLG